MGTMTAPEDTAGKQHNHSSSRTRRALDDVRSQTSQDVHQRQKKTLPAHITMTAYVRPSFSSFSPSRTHADVRAAVRHKTSWSILVSKPNDKPNSRETRNQMLTSNHPRIRHPTYSEAGKAGTVSTTESTHAPRTASAKPRRRRRRAAVRRAPAR